MTFLPSEISRTCLSTLAFDLIPGFAATSSAVTGAVLVGISPTNRANIPAPLPLWHVARHCTPRNRRTVGISPAEPLE